MGYFSEYLDRRLSPDELTNERKAQLRKISELRGGRDVLVYAADLRKPDCSITYEDKLHFEDQLSNLSRKKIDVILETPGGYAEVAEDMVNLLRDRYDEVAFIVPGTAKSAGTIMAMSGDEIVLGPYSSLGPIDAQMTRGGRSFSAEAFLTGIEKIKKETDEKGGLNRAFVPILQNISPGDMQNAENALEFARSLVKRWLATYKFKNWVTHSSTGKAVTQPERDARAQEIATALCNHSRWLSHGRSIKIGDLEQMGLQITNLAQSPDLAEAVARYYTLVALTFESPIFKLIETTTSQIYRHQVAGGGGEAPRVPVSVPDAGSATIELVCPVCKTQHRLQASFKAGVPLEPGVIKLPKDNVFRCRTCGNVANLAALRAEIEAKVGRKVVD